MEAAHEEMHSDTNDEDEPRAWSGSQALSQTAPSLSEAGLSQQRADAGKVRPPAELETTRRADDISEMPVGVWRDIARIRAAAQRVRDSHEIGVM